MYAEKFSPLIHEYPSEAAALQRVANYFRDFEERRGASVLRVRLDPVRLFDISQAGSVARLAVLTKILLDERIIKRELVVRLPAGNGLTFNSYEEIPPIVRDPMRDIDVEVSQDIIEPSYVLVNDERQANR